MIRTRFFDGNGESMALNRGDRAQRVHNQKQDYRDGPDFGCHLGFRFGVTSEAGRRGGASPRLMPGGRDGSRLADISEEIPEPVGRDIEGFSAFDAGELNRTEEPLVFGDAVKAVVLPDNA